MFYRRTAASFGLLAILAGCQTKAEPSVPARYAILRFENLTGDAALEWTGRAASEILSRSLAKALDGPVLTTGALNRAASALGGRPSSAPGISSEYDAAVAAGASRIISGYVSRFGGQFRISSTERDRSFSGTGNTVVQAASNLAKQFSASAAKPVTSSDDALRLMVTGAEGPRESSVPALRAAVQADPNFAPAWILLARATMATGDQAAAKAVIAEAGTHSMSPLDKANLHLEAATLGGDIKSKINALRELTAASPADTDLPRMLAEAETAAGDFASAASDWQKLAAASPENPEIWNQLGYARAWGGNYNGAVAALRDYATLRPKDPNPADSMGDVQFMFGKFADASASYLKANGIDPNSLNGGELYKAAWAKFRAGDLPGADKLLDEFRQRRAKTNSPTGLIAADWLYRTGRKNEAIAAVRAESESAQVPAIRAAAFSQLAVWHLLEGDRPAALKAAEAAGQPASTTMLAIRFAVLPSTSAAEWQARSQKIINGSNAEPIRNLAVGYALLLDGKRGEARPVWARIVATSPATDFFSRAIYAKLTGGPKPLEIVPDPNSVNQFAAILDKL